MFYFSVHTYHVYFSLFKCHTIHFLHSCVHSYIGAKKYLRNQSYCGEVSFLPSTDEDHNPWDKATCRVGSVSCHTQIMFIIIRVHVSSFQTSVILWMSNFILLSIFFPLCLFFSLGIFPLNINVYMYLMCCCGLGTIISTKLCYLAKIMHFCAQIFDGKNRDAKGRKVSGNFGNFPWKVSGILKGWEFSEILGIFNLDLFSTFYEILCTKIN